jgi:hypothetical protein
MARPIEEFSIAWQALSGKDDGGAGWRCISVSPAGPCQIMAARRFPGNEEAILVGFRAVKAPPTEVLPEGVGFEVAREDPHGDGKTWIALTKKYSGGEDMFAEIVCDVAGVIDMAAAAGEEAVLRAMLSRVRAWQEFMRKTPRGLSNEAEVGLAGELVFLNSILDAGLNSTSAVDSWLGPTGGIQDFEIGSGSVEVKATLSSNGFLAKIGSLEQLDDSFRSPLFIAGIRFAQQENGFTLGDMALALAEKLVAAPSAAAEFSDKLVAAGFPPIHFGKYSRKFLIDSVRIFEVGRDFPRLIPGGVPDAIRRVRYDLDLDRLPGEVIPIGEVVERLSVA